ncbi:MAG: hypothetical protein ACJAYA_001048 [Bacteroidia bacterium]|jgi:hypothetical protein
MSKPPLLSIVATTRNDNHGGNLLKRTECFVKGIYAQAQRHSVEIELLIVEWNPPKDRPLLHEVLPHPPNGCPVSLKFVVVPNEIHVHYKTSDTLPLFQMTAKNVGIRRAAGKFVLCTNIDLLFTDELFAHLSEFELEKNHFYRAVRADVPEAVMDIDDFTGQLKYAKENVIAKLGKRVGHEYLFGLPNFVYGFKTTASILNWMFKHWLAKFYTKEFFEMMSLDTHACGDFTMMSKTDWERIEGYPELDLYSIHIDSMGLVAARAIGMTQVIFPPDACSYHIYHQDGWESFKESPIDLIRFIEKRPGLDWGSVDEAGKWMIKHGKKWELNSEDWGWADKDFEEFIFDGNNS